jgi:hypothetical protein
MINLSSPRPLSLASFRPRQSQESRDTVRKTPSLLLHKHDQKLLLLLQDEKVQ